MSLSSCPPKFASCVVRMVGAALEFLRALCSPKPMAKEDNRKNITDSNKIGTLTFVSIWYVSARFTLRNSRYKIMMLTRICVGSMSLWRRLERFKFLHRGNQIETFLGLGLIYLF